MSEQTKSGNSSMMSWSDVKLILQTNKKHKVCSKLSANSNSLVPTDSYFRECILSYFSPGLYPYLADSTEYLLSHERQTFYLNYYK